MAKTLFKIPKNSEQKTAFKNIGLVSKTDDRATFQLLKNLEPLFQSYHKQKPETRFYVAASSPAETKYFSSFKMFKPTPPEKMAQQCDLLISLGGDGTILRSTRYLLESDAWKKCSLLGINAGRLGFLTYVSAEEAKKRLESTLKLPSACSLDRRVCLEATLHRKNKKIKSFHVLNDCVLNKGALSRIFEFTVEIDGEFLSSYRSDGLIVSSPTGSTAYNLAAGGAVIEPQIPAIQLTPICPQSFSNKPIVISDTHEITLKLGHHSTDVFLTLDGQTGIQIETGDSIKIQKSAKNVTFLLPPGTNFSPLFSLVASKAKMGPGRFELENATLTREYFMRLRSCAISDVGRKRQKNEDSYLLNDELSLFVVADGMGGHAGGEYASRIAITTIEEMFRTNADSKVEGETVLKKSIQDAGAKIVAKAEEDRALRGMGTTVICLHIDGKKALLGHVGDSRGYLFRDGTLEQLTEDHSLVNEQVKSGLITAEEAKTHQFKNIITRSVGVTPEVEVDVVTKKLKSGDSFLLCSDGLSNLVDAKEMEKELREREPILAAKSMVDLANKRGGDDNITLVLVEVLGI